MSNLFLECFEYLECMIIDWLPATIVVAVLFMTSRYLGKNVKAIQIAIIGLIIGYLTKEGLLYFHIEMSPSVSDHILKINKSSIPIAIFSLGLEVLVFSVLGKRSFWGFVSLLMVVPGGLYYLYTGGEITDTVGYVATGLLLFTMSLAILSIVIGDRYELFHTDIVRNVVMTCTILDIVLFVVINIVKNIHGDTFSMGVLLYPTIAVGGSIFMVWSGQKCWWRWSIVHRIPPVLWLGAGMVMAYLFKQADLSPALGALFGGLIVSEDMKHHVATKLRPISGGAMIIYMCTVGFKAHSLVSPESIRMACEFIIIGAFAKALVTLYATSAGLFSWKQFFQVLALICGGGSMIIIVAGELGIELVSEDKFQAVMLTAIFWAIFSGWYLGSKNPIRMEKEIKENSGVLKPIPQLS